MKLFDLSGRLALVTGSTKGIGRGIADALVDHGARVVISSRSQGDCDRVASEINAARGAPVAYGVSCDIGDTQSMQAMVDRVIQRDRAIDILVCNAARMPVVVPFGETSEEEFVAQLDVNVNKTLRLCRMVVPGMAARGGGSIILIGSRTAITPAPQQLAYSCAKAAETHLARNMAAHYASQNIRVNCIAPGLIRSDASRLVWENPQALQAFTADIPLARIGEPSEIGGGVVFLASAAGAYVTGVTLPIDGGVVSLPRPPGSSSPTFAAAREPKQ